ncbi:MAG: ABC transporter permease [Proteobacteria bacterium]|nr:ABC transporter permease [Pseudomonadota bacterium]
MHVRNIWFLALATCTEGIRHKALWAIVCLAVLLTMANLGVTTLYSWDLGKVSVEFGLSAVAFTGLLLVFFLGMKILADDLERSRIFMLLSRPVSIWQYLTGKFLGLAMILLLATIILGLSAALSMHYVLWKYPAYVPPNFSWLTYVMALTCQWLSLVVLLAMSVLCFSFASHPFVALLLAVSSYLVGQNMELLRRVVVENPKAGVLTGQENLVVALSWIFPNLSLFDKKYAAAYGMAFIGQEFMLLCLYSISYSALLIYLSTLLFKRKELA